MLFPTYIVDNFFSDPDRVVDLSNSLDFSYDNKRFPGGRTQSLHTINNNFFTSSCSKMLRTIYPNDEHISFSAVAYFQRISKNMPDSGGWIHLDDDHKLTGLVYLNKKGTRGTSFFKPITPYNPPLNIIQKQDYYENYKKYKGDQLEILHKARADANQNFSEVARVEGIYNRLVMFDGGEHHAEHLALLPEDRLTYIVFFERISSKTQGLEFYPLERMRKT